MASIFNTLAALLGQTQEPDLGQSPKNLSGVDVTAHSAQLQPPSQGAVNSVANAYDNRALVQGIDQVEQGYPQHHGMFGVKGTLRNVLGAVGDAFIMKDGGKPMYLPQYQSEKVGDASVGMSSDPVHAIERIRATGIPGSADMAQKAQEDYNTQQLRQATLDNTAAYRESQIGTRQDILKDRQINQATPIIAGILRAGAATKDPDKYAQAYARAAQYAKARNIDINDIGAPDKLEDWQAGYGETANQGQISDDKAAGRKTTERGQDLGYRGRIGAASITAGARPNQEALINQLIAKQKNGQAFSPYEQAFWDANVTRKNAGRRGAGLALTPTGPTPGAPATPGAPGAAKPKYVIRNGKLVPAQ